MARKKKEESEDITVGEIMDDPSLMKDAIRQSMARLASEEPREIEKLKTSASLTDAIKKINEIISQ